MSNRPAGRLRDTGDGAQKRRNRTPTTPEEPRPNGVYVYGIVPTGDRRPRSRPVGPFRAGVGASNYSVLSGLCWIERPGFLG